MSNAAVVRTAADHVHARGGASPLPPSGRDRIGVDQLISRVVEHRIAEIAREAFASSISVRALLDRHYPGELRIDATPFVERDAFPEVRAAARAVRDLDVKLETERVLSAFAAGHYRVFVDGRELLALDEEVSLEKAARARFLRVVPPANG